MHTTKLGEKINVLVDDLETWDYSVLLGWAKEVRRKELNNCESDRDIETQYRYHMSEKGEE